DRTRTPHSLVANQELYQISYAPVEVRGNQGLGASLETQGSEAEGHSVRPSSPRQLVGLSGLEPLTSRLSGGRSNHLSYRPKDSFFKACLQLNRCWMEKGDTRYRAKHPMLRHP